MSILIDTSVLIDHLRGQDAARNAMSAAVRSGERLIGSVLTKTEIIAGMRSNETLTTQRLLSVLHWVPVDEGLAERAGHFANQYLTSHPGIDPVDYVIAATVEREQATLWTRNVKHFPMFPGLAAPY